MASIIPSDSFTANALAQNSVTVTHYVSTKVTKSSGQEVLTFDGSTIPTGLVGSFD